MYIQSCLCDPAVRKDVRVKKIYTGSMRITNQVFEDAYENSNSSEFKALAKQVTSQVRLLLRPSHHCPVLRNEIHLRVNNYFEVFSNSHHSFSVAAVSFSLKSSIPKVHSWLNTMLVLQFRLSGKAVTLE